MPDSQNGGYNKVNKKCGYYLAHYVVSIKRDSYSPERYVMLSFPRFLPQFQKWEW